MVLPFQEGLDILYGSEDTSIIPVTFLAPASPHFMLVGSHSWKTEMAFLLMTGFPLSVMTVLWVFLEHADHIDEVSGGDIDDNNIHLARVESSPGNQAHNMAKSVHFNLHYHVSGVRLALHE